jgi:Lon protease-like protein
MSKLLPLFPLQLVMFPRTQLPLHIFEERYKEMVGEAITNRTEFGIVLAKDDGIVNAGCTVMVDRVITQYPDGRMDIITQGQRRFEIIYINQEKPYLQGEVQFFDDDEADPVPESLQQRVISVYRELAESAEASPLSEPSLDDPQLSFQVAQAVQDLDFQNMLLRSRSEVDRLVHLAEYLERQIPRMKYVARVKRLAPLNGFGHKPAGI